MQYRHQQIIQNTAKLRNLHDFAHTKVQSIALCTTFYILVSIERSVLWHSAIVSARIDSKDKERFDEFCNNVGLSASAAINMFIKSVINEHRIPFEVREPTARYNAKANDIEALKKGIEQLNAGKGIVKTLEELEAMENG